MPHTVSHSVKISMNQLTVKCFNKELAESVRRLAERAGLSLNQAALRLLRNGAGLTEFPGSENTIGSSLDDLFGTWSTGEAEAFNASLDDFEKVDESA